MFAHLVMRVKYKLMGLKKRLWPLRKTFCYIKKPWAYVARHKAAQRLQADANLKPLQVELGQKGFVSVQGAVDDSLLDRVAKNVEAKLARVEEFAITENKAFWKNLVESQDLVSNSDFVQFALQENVLKLVAGYFGQVPYLARLDLFYSPGQSPDSWQGSQLWHRDFLDSKTLKLWTYFNDIETPEQGPFTFIPADVSSQFKRFNSHVTDKEMSTLGDVEQAVQVFGSRLTSFLIDTYRCYHQGSRVASGNFRIALVATYVTFASYLPADNHIKIEGDLPALQKQVLCI